MGILSNRLSTGIAFLKRGVRLVGGTRADAIAARIAEELSPIVETTTSHGAIRFYCPGAVPVFRARTLLTKEPETIRWVDTFQPGEVLWDIGANVGVYSLYAALKHVTVLAFEPSAGNYYLLNRNIQINRMDDRVSGFCVAFNDVTRLAAFHMQNIDLGGALNSFGDAIDWQGAPFKALFKQSMIGFSVDEFIQRFSPQFPNHIKIDVDGNEDKIIAGARGTLSDKRLKSLHVELDGAREEHTRDVVQRLDAAGLRFVSKEHAPEYDQSAFSSSYNYLFRRTDA